MVACHQLNERRRRKGREDTACNLHTCPKEEVGFGDGKLVRSGVELSDNCVVGMSILDNADKTQALIIAIELHFALKPRFQLLVSADSSSASTYRDSLERIIF